MFDLSAMEKRELLDRTKAFALRALKLVDHLPRTTSGRESEISLCVAQRRSAPIIVQRADRDHARNSPQSLVSLPKKPMNLFTGWS